MVELKRQALAWGGSQGGTSRADYMAARSERESLVEIRNTLGEKNAELSRKLDDITRQLSDVRTQVSFNCRRGANCVCMCFFCCIRHWREQR